MIINQCVIDSELFSKVSSDIDYSNLNYLIEFKRDNNEFEDIDVHDCKCFYELLKAIQDKKCKIALNDVILRECIRIAKKCPTDIRTKFHFIISQNDCHDMFERKMHHTKKEKFKSTPLESKIPYIDVAHQLDNKNIVSTKNHCEVCDKECFEQLSEVQVFYIDACYVLNHESC